MLYIERKIKKCCSICGDKDSTKYYIWHGGGEFNDKEICNKHYFQLVKHGYLLDKIPSNHKPRHKWTSEEDNILENLYKQGLSFENMSEQMGLTLNTITSRSHYLKLGDKYTRSNNPKFKAVYQDYDWCYQRYIVKGMPHEEMAKEAGTSLRTIQKWCSEVHKLNSLTFKEKKKLSDLQYQIVLFGTLGDGHIDKRENQPIYIESHAIDEKDYLFWKYSHLKDLCMSPPKYYKESYINFGDKTYKCLPLYRFETRIVNQLKEIREMPRLEKINMLNELGLVLHVLDDGCRRDLWELCLAEYTQQEIDAYILICKEKFNLKCWQAKDKRYIKFDANSSRLLDSLIIKIMPSNLDIVQKKVLNNPNIPKLAQYVYVTFDKNNKKTGLKTYCRSHKIPYLKAKEIANINQWTEVSEDTLLNSIEKENIKYAIS